MSTHESQVMTAAVMLLIAALTILYDVGVVHWFGPDASISRVCGLWFHRYPLLLCWLLFGAGLYFGHVFLSAWR